MSLRALALESILRRVIRPDTGVDFDAELQRRRTHGPPDPAKVPQSVARRFLVTERLVEAARVVTLTVPGRAAHAALVYLPGGGYAHPITSSHWTTVARIASAARMDAIVPLYRLAPAGDAEQAHLLVATVLHDALERYGASQVSIAGDSAGAGLALAALQRHPVGVGSAVLLNPWLDVQMRHPASRRMERWDVILRVRELQLWGLVWANTVPADDPRVSPLNGTFDALPPVHIVTGGRDLLLPDALEAHRLLHRAGNPGELLYAPDANHAVGLTGAGTPEARSAFRAVVRWLRNDPSTPVTENHR